MRDDLVRRTLELLVIRVPLPLNSHLGLTVRLEGGVETEGGGGGHVVFTVVAGAGLRQAGLVAPYLYPALSRPGPLWR